MRVGRFFFMMIRVEGLRVIGCWWRSSRVVFDRLIRGSGYFFR